MKSATSIEFGLVLCAMLLNGSTSFENATNNINANGEAFSAKRSYMEVFNNLSTPADQQTISLTTESYIVENTNNSEEFEPPRPSKFLGCFKHKI